MSGSKSFDTASVAVITGGSSGIGLACAQLFGARHQLVLVDIQAEKLEATAAALRAAGHTVTPVVTDITAPAQVEKLAETVRGLGKFALLVNAAGISPTMANGRRILEVNLIGTARIASAFLPLAGPGSVAVLIASSAGHMAGFNERSDPAMRDPLRADFWAQMEADTETPERAYSAGKRGVIVYAQAQAAAWGVRGARIVTISPGMIETPMGDLEFSKQPLMKTMLEMTPLQRQGKAHEIAALAEFLGSQAAAFITGSDFLIDGGITARLRNLAG
jgi:NAD(P)-dependent dehydrogenase (short-subunit alcohol dehydrogenase family)